MTALADLAALLGPLAAADPEPAWRPVLFDPGDPDRRAALGELLVRGEVVTVHDVLDDQVSELLTSRRPDWRPGAAELAEAVAAHLAGPAAGYGCWAWYPWSRRLVHVLPRAEFRELRQSRNRYKITAPEQDLLADRTIAVVGLSVGAASAVTLAQEGVGSRFRLADFDTLSLSNLNRLRASVADLGLPKTVLCARQMYELDPYLEIELWPEGLHEENTDAFLTANGRADLLVEECDDLYLKLFARERARVHGIAVLMETNERGMLDVERFDLEPDRPLLHGLLDGVAAADLRTLSTREKVPHVLQILDQERPSQRFVPSLVEIGRTISSWPQLASGVALGAALVTDTARRLLLGEFAASGRYFVDLPDLVCEGTGTARPAAAGPAGPAGSAGPAAPSEVREPELRLPEPGRAWSEETVRRLVAHAVRAPSGGNAQPWLFVSRNRTLECRVDGERASTLLDFERSAGHLAIGAAVENIALAAGAAGWACRARAFPDPADPLLACELTFSEDGSATPSALVEWIGRRSTDRAPGDGRPLAVPAATALARCAAASGARLQLVEDREQLRELGSVLGAADRLRMMSRPLHRDMMSELRWGEREVTAGRDGIDVAALALDPPDLAGVAIARHWPNLAFLQRIGGGSAFEQAARRLVASSSAIGILSIPGTTPRAYLRGGRALQRLWLTAASHGVALHPLTPLLYLLARAERGGGVGLAPDELTTLRGLRTRLAAIAPHRPGEAELMLFRLSYAPPTAVRSLRREVDAVLRFE